MYCTYPFLPLNFSLIKIQRPGRNVERSILKFFMNARSKLILDCKKKTFSFTLKHINVFMSSISKI